MQKQNFRFLFAQLRKCFAETDRAALSSGKRESKTAKGGHIQGEWAVGKAAGKWGSLHTLLGSPVGVGGAWNAKQDGRAQALRVLE